jgi:Conserved oligomeric complex COG6
MTNFSTASLVSLDLRSQLVLTRVLACLIACLCLLRRDGRGAACRWVQQQCQALAEADASEVDPLLATAAAALRGQPVLLRYCAEEVASARHSAVFHTFLMALTRGGPGGVPKPLEAHSRNPRCAPEHAVMVNSNHIDCNQDTWLCALLGCLPGSHCTSLSRRPGRHGHGTSERMEAFPLGSA